MPRNRKGNYAFSLGLSYEFNFLVSPVYLLSKTIHHFLSSSFEARALLVCSLWLSATFWPLLHKKVNEFHGFVDDSFTLKDTTNYIKLAENEKSFIGSKTFKGEVLILFLRTGSKTFLITIITLLVYCFSGDFKKVLPGIQKH